MGISEMKKPLNMAKFIVRKAKAESLSQDDYNAIVKHMMAFGVDKHTKNMFYALDQFGMTKDETLFLARAIRDSGKVFHANELVLEKHSTGGIGDSTSIVLIPLLACLGYKIVKTTGKSLVFANGSADRFKAIPGFQPIEYTEINKALSKNNACVLAHGDEYCPADSILYKIIETYHFEDNICFLAASIVAKKLTSDAKVVLVDIKYGEASVISKYSTAKQLASLLVHMFKKCGVKCVIAITNTHQLIGESVGNAVEVLDALDVLKGKQNMLREVSVAYAVEMMLKADKRLNRKDAYDMAVMALDSGLAYNQFLDIVRTQHGDVMAVKNNEIFNPKQSIVFKTNCSGYVGNVNALLMGELIRRLCVETHNNNIGLVLHVKIGDYVNAGDKILTLYCENKQDVAEYIEAVKGCVRLTQVKVKKVNPIRRLG